MFGLKKPSLRSLHTSLDRARAADVTYLDDRVSAREAPPPGYRHDRHDVLIGVGDEVFRRAVAGLKGWQAHVGAGVEVFPAGEPIQDGTTVILVLRTGPLWAVAPCRIVWVEDRSDRSGFAYGTLPGHPERGESAFEVRRDPSGEVHFRIDAVSRPAALVARAARPVARLIQRAVTRRYVEALRALAEP